MSACGGEVEARRDERAPAVLVRSFREAAANGDRSIVSRWVAYPLLRPYPVPPVRDPEDFVRRFAELLPPELLAEVADSTDSDWEPVGSRGRMLANGRLWVDAVGRLAAINSQSVAERRRYDRLVERDRAALPRALRDHEAPLFCWETARFRVRVDRMPGGELRYTSWLRSAPPAAEPDLVLFDGERRFDGSGGNCTWTWRNGDYGYQCVDLRLHGDGQPRTLRVTKGDDELICEAATMRYPQ